MKVAAKCILFLLTVAMPVLLSGQGNSGEIVQVRKVVIDPGHGGRSAGCVYGGFLEKDINLNIALKLADLIKKNMPDVEVILTRKEDKTLGLLERSEIANKAKADLFLSIHINANKSTAISGTSTYIMGVDNSEQNLQVAMTENDVIIYEEDYSTKYEGYTPGDPTSYIMFSLMQSANRNQSTEFSRAIQKHFNHELPLRDLGVRQASLLVLWKCSMPAVLTEIGFLSNDRDRTYISSNKGQSAAARALCNALSEYKSMVEGSAGSIIKAGEGGGSVSLPDPKEQLSPEQQRAVEQAALANNSAQKPAATKPATATKPAQSQGQQTAQTGASTAGQVKHNVRFYVQVSSLAKPKSINSNDFKSYKGKVIEKKTGTVYRYLVGPFATYAQLQRELPAVRRVFKDAFPVAFEGDAQIKLDEARRKAQ